MSKYSRCKGYLMLYPNCVMTRGFSRSTICDLQYSRFDYIPNALVGILEDLRGNSLKIINDRYNSDDRLILDEYVDFLLDRRYVFISDDKIEFLSLDDVFIENEVFTNSILEVGLKSDGALLENIFLQLQKIGVWAIKIIVKDTIDLQFLFKVLWDKSFSHIEFVLDLKTFDKNVNLFVDPRIKQISIYGCEESKKVISEGVYYIFNVEKISSISQKCANISFDSFVVNMPMYRDFILGNTCLFGKICVTEIGLVKRCIFSSRIFGHILDKDFSYLRNEEFVRLGKIRKVEINRCQDCEHRIMCIDCRTFTQSIENEYSSPLYCKYDPYKGKWL